jgi:hypothetical protein
MAAELNDVVELFGIRGEVQRREDFADQRPNHAKRERRAARMAPLLLQERVRGGGQGNVPIPAG